MYTEGFDQWMKMNKNFSSPMSDLSKATTNICRNLTQEGMEMLTDNISLVSDQMKRISSVRKPEDYLNLSRECITEDMNAWMSNIQKIMQLSMQTMEELTRLSSNLRETATNISKTNKSEKAHH